MKRKAALLGLGRLQLGLMGHLFSNLGYQLIGINLGNDPLVARLRKLGYYRVIDEPPNGGYDIELSEVYCAPLSADSDELNCAVASAATAEIINCALGTTEAALDSAAQFLLKVEQFRRQNAIVSPLFVTASDNPLGTRFAITEIRDRLQSLIHSLKEEDARALANDMAYHWHFPETIADRICSTRIIPERDNKPVMVTVEPYREVVCGRLFLSLRPLLGRGSASIGEITIRDNLELHRQRKIYTLNLAHAIAGYLGCLHEKAPKTISDALRIPEIYNTVEFALTDIARAMASRDGSALGDWNEYAGTVLRRISEPALNDPIDRIIAEVPRKLLPGDRLVGPLMLVAREIFTLSAPIISGIAHALAAARLASLGHLPILRDEDSLRVGAELQKNPTPQYISSLLGLKSTDPLEGRLLELVLSQFNQIALRQPS